MKEIKITDGERKEGSFFYLTKSIAPLVNDFGGKIIESHEKRSEARVFSPLCHYDLFRREIEDKIGDIITIKYKYDYFKRNLHVVGLSDIEKEILYFVLISADLEDDKRYVLRRLKAFKEFSIDGIFNFRLIPLKRKWEEVVSCIPSFFTKKNLYDFANYVVSEKRNKRVIVDDGKVYDGNYNLLNKRFLIGEREGCEVVKEVLLSSCNSVDVKGELDTLDEKYLKIFFGRGISFSTQNDKTVYRKF